MLTLEAYGGDRVAAAFAKVRARLRDLSDAWRLIGADVLSTAVRLTPVQSGALVRSLRVEVRPDYLSVQSSLIYAGVQNRGWPARNIEARNFLTGRTFSPNESGAVRNVENAIEAAARRAGLPVG